MTNRTLRCLLSLLNVTIATLVSLAWPSPAHAQAPASLTVTVRDSKGAGVAGITVSVLDRAGVSELGRGVTDSQGAVAFLRLPADTVRVAVVGALIEGAELAMIGEDTAGIALSLTAPPTRLDLRVEPDGRVLPDPETMILPDHGLPAGDDLPPLPTASRATPLIPTSVAIHEPTPSALSAERAPAAETLWWPGLLVLTLLIASIGAVIWLRAARRIV